MKLRDWQAIAIDATSYITQGPRCGLLYLRMLPEWSRPFISPITQAHAETLVNNKQVVPLPAALRVLAAQADTTLRDALDRLERGVVGYKLLQGDRLEIFCDGQCDGVSPVSQPAALLGLMKQTGEAVRMGIERDVHAGTPERALVTLPAGLLDAIRRQR